MVHENSLPTGDRDDFMDPEQSNMERQIKDMNAQLCSTNSIVSQKAIWLNAEIHGWHEPACDLATDLLLIHSEISEACEAARKGVLHMSTAADSVEEELADAVIRIFHVAEKNGFDICKAVHKKHQRNMSRPYRHGGKKF